MNAPMNTSAITEMIEENQGDPDFSLPFQIGGHTLATNRKQAILADGKADHLKYADTNETQKAAIKFGGLINRLDEPIATIPISRDTLKLMLDAVSDGAQTLTLRIIPMGDGFILDLSTNDVSTLFMQSTLLDIKHPSTKERWIEANTEIDPT